jgi:hypothetical protein
MFPSNRYVSVAEKFLLKFTLGVVATLSTNINVTKFDVGAYIRKYVQKKNAGYIMMEKEKLHMNAKYTTCKASGLSLQPNVIDLAPVPMSNVVKYCTTERQGRGLTHQHKLFFTDDVDAGLFEGVTT